MRLAAFNGDHIGVVVGDRIIDIAGALGDEITKLRPRYRMNALIADFAKYKGKIEALAKDGGGVALSSVKLGPPLAQPTVMLFPVGNYKEGTEFKTNFPVFVLKPAAALIGDGGTVKFPEDEFGIIHHEAELAVVIGSTASHVTADKAMDHVFGYTATIDVVARGEGYEHGVICNGFETFGPMGPWIVTKDEIPDPQNLRVRLWQDDVLRQDYNTADMERSVAELIAWLSQITALEPGDVVTCGSDYRGLGPMQDGEKTTIEIEKIGKITVTTSDPKKRRWAVGIDAAAAKELRRSRESGGPFDQSKAYTPQIKN